MENQMTVIAQFTFVGGADASSREIFLVRDGSRVLVAEDGRMRSLRRFQSRYGGEALTRIVGELGPKRLPQLNGTIVEWGRFTDSRPHRFVRIVGGISGRKFYRRF